jgi:primosomal protein N' (replication factor Y)
MAHLFAHDEPELHTPAAGGEWTYLRVAVERGMDRGGTEAALTYRSAAPVELGRRVEVPLGRGNTAAAGIVVEVGGIGLCEGFAPDKVKSILRDAGVGLPAKLVELARWISGYYVCPVGMVLAAMMPAAVKKRTGHVVRELLDRVEPEVEASLVEVKMTKATRVAWGHVAALGREALPLDAHVLAERIGAANIGALNKLVNAGLLRRVEREEVRSIGGAPDPVLIEQKGTTQERVRLSADQDAAVEGISGTLGGFGVHVLYGVTGSGKTEVYLRIIERVLAKGQSALVLVPEISLTPQTAGRFQARFGAASGAGVAVLHSGLSASQRHAQWAAAASGKARVVVGARSAVFAPLERLGVIVVDEEHASDYKQDQLPRYHGRDVAIKRAQLEGCPVVLGSATPSLETWANAFALEVAKQQSSKAANEERNGESQRGGRGRYALWRLRERVGGGAMPRVEVVDLREEWKLRAHAAIRGETRGGVGAREHMLGPTLERALGETLRDGGQAILLLNRRGYSCYIACADARCGYVLSCGECDARMVEHRLKRGADGGFSFVRCHHCLAQQRVPAKCPVCEGRIHLLGMGTQRVEEELQTKFGRILAASGADEGWLVRVDGDTMKTGREFHELLERFASGEVRVLVGTQMIAKGLDFPNVRLVGVINADTALSLPDFRAAERTFQLVSQVAGRAGRGEHAGRVFVQTLEPDAPAIVHAAAHDFESFAREELEFRAGANLPPITRMARIVCRDEDLAKANAAAEGIARALKEEGQAIGGGGLGVIGPMPCPVSRIAGFHRVSIEVVGPRRGLVQEALMRVRARGLLKSDARTAVDVDPIALM